jgi:hypothetical protein
MSELNNKILSDITVHMKYAKYIPELQRRETWEELVDRNKAMHVRKYPSLENDINTYYKYVYEKKILPSMRSLQFGGKPIEISPNRLYNCAYLPIDHIDAFSEVMFLLLSGCGVGYSVQLHNIKKLPEIIKPHNVRKRRFVIGDSIEGWSDAIKVLIKSYLGSKRSSKIKFDYSDIRPKGARLVTSGGKAPGPQPLRECLVKIKGILDGKQDGEKLSSLEVHDIVCHIADAVLAGGIRRAALISLFSAYDEKMISCKSGNWWEKDPQRGRANNSAVLMRHKITKEFFIGTLQAGYTEFHYLREVWQETTEKDALIGVSMTGIASGKVLELNMNEAADHVKVMNRIIAKTIGIKPAARATTVKPAGTTSLVLGTSSGIHAWHNRYYVRRLRVGKNEAIYTYLSINHPELLEDDYFRPHDTAVISIPQKAPKGSIIRTEKFMDLLERIKKVATEWVKPGHKTGSNSHNVSATVSLKENEWEEAGEWMWKNRDHYNGLSVLPYDGGTYVQAPFEDVTKQIYNDMTKTLHNVNLSEVVELEDNTDLSGELACAGGNCEVT